MGRKNIPDGITASIPKSLIDLSFLLHQSEFKFSSKHNRGKMSPILCQSVGRMAELIFITEFSVVLRDTSVSVWAYDFIEL